MKWGFKGGLITSETVAPRGIEMSALEDPEDLERVLVRISVEAARHARELSGVGGYGDVVSRNPVGDVTRRIDAEVEDYVVDLVRSSGLRALIVTEESGLVETSTSPDVLLILDPLDGSVNYVSGIPYCGMSIAAASRVSGAGVGDVLAGAVAEIFRDRVYSFSRGLGARVNGEDASKSLGAPVDVVLAYFEEPDLVGRIHRIWLKLGRPKIRSLGAASLDIVLTSMGRFRAFVDLRGRLRNVDVAAAIGFARELGAFAVDEAGRALDIPLDRLSRIGSIVVSRDPSVLEALKP